MEARLRLKVSELDATMLKHIRHLFSSDEEITLTIQSASDFGLNKQETKKEYFARLKKAIANIEGGEKVELTGLELLTK
jgi:tRNA A37 methylthiotransferase MiaB